MNIYFLIFIACIPIILMCTYIYKKDNDKEPAKTLRKIFIYGIISIIPIVILELLASKVIIDKRNIASLFINVFVTVGLIEEGIKWGIVNKSIYNDEEFNHPYDAIIYSVFVSLGFALVENFIYVIGEGFRVGVLRAITTIPAHTFTAIIMGYFLGKSKQEDVNKNDQSAKKYMFLSLIIPILCHTLYDFFVFRETGMATILFLLMVVAIYIIIIKIVGKVSKIPNNFDGSKYDSKERIKYESNSSLFTDSLVKVLVITLVLIAIYALLVLAE